MDVAITNLSSRGQVVIPQGIRKQLRLKTGSKFAVFTDGANLLFSPLSAPNLKSFEKLVTASRAIAAKKKLKPSDVTKIIKGTRDEGST